MDGEHECFLINISSMLPVFPEAAKNKFFGHLGKMTLSG